MVVIGLTSYIIAWKVGRVVSDTAFLAYHYGLHRAASEGLRVTYPGRLELRISNGDVLGEGAAKSLGLVWVLVAFPTLLALVWAETRILRKIAPTIAPPHP